MIFSFCSVVNVRFSILQNYRLYDHFIERVLWKQSFLVPVRSYIIDFTTLLFKLCFIYLASNAKCVYVLVHNIKMYLDQLE
jgi:hypothetical protein